MDRSLIPLAIGGAIIGLVLAYAKHEIEVPNNDHQEVRQLASKLSINPTLPDKVISCITYDLMTCNGKMAIDFAVENGYHRIMNYSITSEPINNSIYVNKLNLLVTNNLFK